jgi:Peptidase M50B-like
MLPSYHRIRSPLDPIRVTAEHEAAHATVAHALGVPVLAIELNDDASGVTYMDRDHANATCWNLAVVASAGALWEREFIRRRHPSHQYDRYNNMFDLEYLERTIGASRVWLAEFEARAILDRNEAATRDLADRVELERPAVILNPSRSSPRVALRTVSGVHLARARALGRGYRS